MSEVETNVVELGKQLDNLKESVNSMDKDCIALCSGNKASSTRFRKALQKVITTCLKMRKNVLNYKKALPVVKKVSKASEQKDDQEDVVKMVDEVKMIDEVKMVDEEVRCQLKARPEVPRGPILPSEPIRIEYAPADPIAKKPKASKKPKEPKKK